MYDKKFDPLNAKYTGNEAVVILSIQREINNILNSYVGWFDPFCELIQNALDSVEKRMEKESEMYVPQVKIIVNIQENSVTVTDNGVGFSEEEYTKFLAPNFSFKNGNTRGHKGVGATYLAYGFNYIQIATKSPDFEAVGVMKNARKWLSDVSPAGNPKVEPDYNPVNDEMFESVDRGVSITVKYDNTTYPKNLSWIGINKAKEWLDILRVKTGLGAIEENSRISLDMIAIDKNGNRTQVHKQGIDYLSITDFVSKAQNYTVIQNKMSELFSKKGPQFRMPSKLSNLEAIYDKWEYTKILTMLKFTEEQKKLIEVYKPTVIFYYVYSINVWNKINEKIGIRKGLNVLYGGIQIAANNMPQGELIQIPLNKNIGRQNQAHIVIHFEKCSADLGRKGFKKEITDLAKDISRKLLDGPLMKIKQCFKKNTGAAPDLIREKKISEWKEQMIEHEKNNPLELKNENFFKPLHKISITSIPTREQDVIALFNQLIAGGVIRGIRIMATNERSTYDGLYRIVIEEPTDNHIYDKEKNPLGIEEEIVERFKENSKDGFVSEPNVLEYKYSLDGLVEDVEDGVKNTNDIGLVVAWEAGDLYKRNYYIESLLLEENVSLRSYHGVTHRLRDISTGEYVSELILLKDLILYLCDYEQCITLQEKYDED